MTERREFLKKVAKGAAYAAPVVYTLSTPRDLHAIVTSGMIMFMRSAATAESPDASTTAPWSVPPKSTAPWEAPAPWGKTPSIPPPSGGASDNE